MNDFLRLIINEFKDALPLAFVAVALCALGVGVSFLIFKLKYKDTRKFPFAKVLLYLALAGYIAAVLAVTVLRSEGLSGTNLHLFRAWREAWNSFSFKNWANVLLNIAMFIPLGVLLPWMSKPFRKWYASFLCALGISLAIEVFQSITGRGLFDVDDLFANTLGALFGYGLFMAVFSALEKREKKALRISAYAAIPTAIALAVSSIFIVYALRPYGNLPNAAIYKVSTKGVSFNSECELSDEGKTVPVYRAQRLNTQSCDEFGLAFLKGRTDLSALDICYYDNETYYLDHREHSLFVSHFDGSYEYSYHPDGKRQPAELDREGIEKLLADYGIFIPETALFCYEGDGWHLFESPMSDGEAVGGRLRCRYSAEGFIYAIHNGMVSFETCAEEEIISESEAFERMKKGRFFGDVFEFISPKSVTLLSCSLEYQADTKGFYQPVYMLKVMYDGSTDELGITIPALK